jgi:uncharacterized Zn finger protein (UPF0148 family)
MTIKCSKCGKIGNTGYVKKDGRVLCQHCEIDNRNKTNLEDSKNE